MELVPPLRFRFADPEDVAAHGDRWWSWNEAEIVRLRSADLIALEEAVDMRMKTILREMREDGAAALTAVMWIAMHRAGHTVPFKAFDPAVILVAWEADPGPLDPAGSGEDPAPESPSSTPPTTESVSS